MNFKKFLSFIMILSIVFAFSGCLGNEKANSSLNIPDKINIYANGKQRQILKSGDKYDQTLFKRIIRLVYVKLPEDFSTVKSEISDKDIKDIKEYGVEFIYDKPQTLTISSGNKEVVKFTEIIFPLSEKWENTGFIKIKDDFYTPIGLNENLDYLVKSSAE